MEAVSAESSPNLNYLYHYTEHPSRGTAPQSLASSFTDRADSSEPQDEQEQMEKPSCIVEEHLRPENSEQKEEEDLHLSSLRTTTGGNSTWPSAPLTFPSSSETLQISSLLEDGGVAQPANGFPPSFYYVGLESLQRSSSPLVSVRASCYHLPVPQASPEEELENTDEPLVLVE
ncbi:hypothetical protein JCM3765_006831 [Sporobolomyces pararoseus]